MKRLAFTLLLVGCGGGTFSSDDNTPDAAVGTAEPDVRQPAQPVDDFDSGGAGGSGGSIGTEGGSPPNPAEDAGSKPDATPTRDAGIDTPPACVNGALRCSGAQPEVCASGEWFASGDACADATPLCVDGRCVECAPGERSCSSPDQPSVCDANGFFVPDGDACTDATPQCLDGACIACDPANVRTAGYCDCGAGVIACCQETFGEGCGCFSLNGCQ